MKWVYFCRLKSHLPNSMFKIFSYSKNKVKKKINLVGRPEGLDCSGCAINIKDCSGVNFTNILPTSSFLYENIFLQFFSNYMCSFVFFGKRILAQKLPVKCWWYWLQGAVEILQKNESNEIKSQSKNSIHILSFGKAEGCKNMFDLLEEVRHNHV